MIYSKRQLKMYLKPLCNTTHSWVVRLDFIIDFRHSDQIKLLSDDRYRNSENCVIFIEKLLLSFPDIIPYSGIKTTSTKHPVNYQKRTIITMIPSQQIIVRIYIQTSL